MMKLAWETVLGRPRQPKPVSRRKPARPGKTKPGWCRSCRLPIVVPVGKTVKAAVPFVLYLVPDGYVHYTRALWHPWCVDEYLILATPRLFLKPGMSCRACGVVPRTTAGLDVDHVVPLWKGGAHAIQNFQALCEPCHKLKTKAEAAERAALRKSRAGT